MWIFTNRERYAKNKYKSIKCQNGEWFIIEIVNREQFWRTMTYIGVNNSFVVRNSKIISYTVAKSLRETCY